MPESPHLNSPFKDKERVKALGARWDPERRQWYVPEGKDLAPFDRWLRVSGGAVVELEQISADSIELHISSTQLTTLSASASDDVPANVETPITDEAGAVTRGIPLSQLCEVSSAWSLRLVELMGSMARSVGAIGQLNQQTAMLARPDSHEDLSRVRIPTLIMCGRQDPVTPLADHEGMAACVPGSRLEVIENCGHLATIEQPEAVALVLTKWLRESEGSV